MIDEELTRDFEESRATRSEEEAESAPFEFSARLREFDRGAKKEES